MTDPDAQPKSLKWSKAKIDAAELLAEDVLTDAQIATKLGITDRTLRTWKHHPEFAARVDAHVSELQERARKAGLARLDKRIGAYTDRHRRMSELLEARAEAGGRGVGADTGTLVKTFKVVGAGPAAYEVEEWAFDAALMRELRELEKQIAQDAGQWSEKREVSGPGGGPVPILAIEVPRPSPDAE